MKVSRRLFVSSAIFSTVIAVAYWFLTYEPTGTLMLGFMATALTVVAVYMRIAERSADLWGDRGGASPGDAAGEEVGTYTMHSALPFWTAFAFVLILLGFVVSPTTAVGGIIIALVLGAAFLLRSR